MKDLFNELILGLRAHGSRNAFLIGPRFHSYSELADTVDQIRNLIRQSSNDPVIALFAHDHLLTYAAILAHWAEGRAYVPLSTDSPLARNLDILQQSGARHVLSCSPPRV